MHGFVSGALAGLVVDVCLYPIDTIKTRMQSRKGFMKSGGFSRIYRGLLPVLVGSMPSAGLFFAVYDHLDMPVPIRSALGEIAACLVRVPVDNSKMHQQVGQVGSTLYKGFGLTILRDVPFSVLQFMIYEQLKPYSMTLASMCAGSISALVTTPLDVIRTRMILSNIGFTQAVKQVLSDGAMWHGALPRTIWIGIGGYIFLGVHETLKDM